MTLPLKALRRRFMVRTAAVIAGLLLGFAVVFRILPLRPHGVVLGIFLAAALLILAIRCLNEIWSKSALEFFQEIRNVVGFAESKARAVEVEAESEEFCERLILALAETRRDSEDRRRLIGEVFHALGQPLTAVRCSLELGLRNALSAEQYRQRLEDALEQAERMARLTNQFRRLAEAIEFDDAGKICRFDHSLNTAQEEITAWAEAKQIRFSMASAPAITVPGDQERLAEALFYILQFSLDCAPHQSEVVARSEISGGEIIFTVEWDLAKEERSSQTLDDRGMEMSAVCSSPFGVRIAEHIVSRLGGRLERELSAGAQIMRARLPVVGILSDRQAEQKIMAP